jgi:hypothetical protein
MGVIKQGILGGFSGSVANVVGSSWKGIAIIKAKPLSVANPQTAAQTDNRDQFSQCVAFAKAILTATIKPLLDRIAVKMSGYNLFVMLNKALFDADGLLTVANLVISQGTVTAVDTLAGNTDDGNDQVLITWVDNTGVGDALGTDVMYGCLYNATKNEAISIPSTSTRASEALTAPTPEAWDDADVKHLYAAFRKADGTRSSNTSYAACDL